MRILWYNWKDITNPASGGAEVLTHEIAKRLVRKDHRITLFCSSYPNCKKEDSINDVRIIREGGKYSVYLKAKKYYKRNKENFDLVVDEINTRPFLTPDYVDKPIIALIHQLAREFWFYDTKFPLNLIGYYFLENRWLKKYKRVPTITVSKSTESDLKKLGFQKIQIIREGLSHRPLKKVPDKEKRPTVIFVGRLKKPKLPDSAIKSFLIIEKKVKDAQMWLVGDGNMMDELQKLANESTSITFFGRVSDQEKLNLMSKAHLLLVPGIREGWGLVVTEANSMGTPAIGYDVPGLRDSISNNVNGILTKKNSASCLAEEAIKLFSDRELLREMSINSLKHAQQFNWDYSAEQFDKIINDVI